MEKIKKLIKKLWTREVLLYFVFGVLTSIINVGLSYLLKAAFNVEENIASTIGIITCVLFAYFTNRKMVFNSQAEGFKENLIEFGKFMLGRAFTMVVEIVGVFLLVNILHLFYELFADKIAFLIDKCIVSFIVIILNFFISKFYSFKSNK